jgi:hypothetical protein
LQTNRNPSGNPKGPEKRNLNTSLKHYTIDKWNEITPEQQTAIREEHACNCNNKARKGSTVTVSAITTTPACKAPTSVPGASIPTKSVVYATSPAVSTPKSITLVVLFKHNYVGYSEFIIRWRAQKAFDEALNAYDVSRPKCNRKYEEVQRKNKIKGVFHLLDIPQNLSQLNFKTFQKISRNLFQRNKHAWKSQRMPTPTSPHTIIFGQVSPLGRPNQHTFFYRSW